MVNSLPIQPESCYNTWDRSISFKGKLYHIFEPLFTHKGLSFVLEDDFLKELQLSQGSLELLLCYTYHNSILSPWSSKLQEIVATICCLHGYSFLYSSSKGINNGKQKRQHSFLIKLLCLTVKQQLNNHNIMELFQILRHWLSQRHEADLHLKTHGNINNNRNIVSSSIIYSSSINNNCSSDASECSSSGASDDNESEGDFSTNLPKSVDFHILFHHPLGRIFSSYILYSIKKNALHRIENVGQIADCMLSMILYEERLGEKTPDLNYIYLLPQCKHHQNVISSNSSARKTSPTSGVFTASNSTSCDDSVTWEDQEKEICMLNGGVNQEKIEDLELEGQEEKCLNDKDVIERLFNDPNSSDVTICGKDMDGKDHYIYLHKTLLSIHSHHLKTFFCKLEDEKHSCTKFQNNETQQDDIDCDAGNSDSNNNAGGIGGIANHEMNKRVYTNEIFPFLHVHQKVLHHVLMAIYKQSHLKLLLQQQTKEKLPTKFSLDEVLNMIEISYHLGLEERLCVESAAQYLERLIEVELNAKNMDLLVEICSRSVDRFRETRTDESKTSTAMAQLENKIIDKGALYFHHFTEDQMNKLGDRTFRKMTIKSRTVQASNTVPQPPPAPSQVH